MRCSTWRGNDLTKLNRQVQLWVCPRFEPLIPHLCISYTGREPVYLLSFIPSASCRSNSFPILSPTPLLGVETPQQVQATSDRRSRISTKACSPITCVTGCATKSQHRICCISYPVVNAITSYVPVYSQRIKEQGSERSKHTNCKICWKERRRKKSTKAG